MSIDRWRDGGMDSSCLPTSPCSACCVTLCQHFVLCIANDSSGLPLLLFVRSVCLSILRSLAESQTNEILPEVDGRRVRGARPLLVCLLRNLTSLKRPGDFFTLYPPHSAPLAPFFFYLSHPLPSLHSSSISTDSLLI